MNTLCIKLKAAKSKLQQQYNKATRAFVGKMIDVKGGVDDHSNTALFVVIGVVLAGIFLIFMMNLMNKNVIPKVEDSVNDMFAVGTGKP